ncbi:MULTISPECIES: hypothetical protein [unclassified Streptomyces]|uniref:hypothetical protein n=1 Tax=unclassified Streptomyces TaxID=2593676 RepID=UPI0037FF9BF3
MEVVLVNISPKVRAHVLNLIAAGCGIKLCALIVGCDEHAVRRWLYRGEEERAPDTFGTAENCSALTSTEVHRARQARGLIMSGASIPDTARAMAVPERRVVLWLAGNESRRFPVQ